MTIYPTIADALKRVIEQKEGYDKNLLGKEFLYVYVDKQQIICQQVVFKKRNYLHLTGLDCKGRQSIKRTQDIAVATLSEDFYNRLGVDSTLINDISFIQEATSSETSRTYNNTQNKLENLSKLTVISKKADRIGKYTGPVNFDFVIGRGSELIVLGRDFDNPDIFVPVSSRNGRIETIAKDIKPVLCIFQKDKTQNQYSLCYLNIRRR